MSIPPCSFVHLFVYLSMAQFSSVQSPVLSNSLQPHGLQPTGLPVHHQLLELAQTHVHPTISSSVIPFSSCLQSFPASGSFLMSQFFHSGGQSIGASASILPVNIQGWFPLGLTGLISLLSKDLSRVFSSTSVGKHQLLDTQPSLWFSSHNHT